MEEKKKNNIGLKVLVVILIILLIGAIGYICYDKGLFDGFVKSNEPKKETKVEEKLSEEEVMKLHESIVVNDTDLYFPENTTIENVKAENLLPYVLTKYVKDKGISKNSYDHIHDCNIDAIVNGAEGSDYNDNKLHLCKYDEAKEDIISISKEAAVSIPKTEIDKMIKETFNTEKVFELNDHTAYTGQQYVPSFVYSSDDNNFYIVTPMTAGDLGIYNMKAKMLRYDEKDGILNIYDKIVKCMGGLCYNAKKKSYDEHDEFVLANSNRNYETNVIIDEKIVLDKENFTINFDYILEKYSDKFDTYKTTYKKGNDGKYYWYSTEKVNE